MYKANEICVNFKNDKWESKKEGSSNWIEKGQVLRMISSILVASEVYHSSQSKAVGLLEKLSRAFLKMSEKIREGIDQGDDWKKADTFLSYQSYCRKETFKGNSITCNCSNSTDDSSDQNLISTMIWIKNGPSLPWFLAIPHFGFTPAVAVANSWGPVFEVGPFFIDHLLQFPPREVLPLCLKGPLSKSIGQRRVRPNIESANVESWMSKATLPNVFFTFLLTRGLCPLEPPSLVSVKMIIYL